jgi:hypothetical protein
MSTGVLIPDFSGKDRDLSPEDHCRNISEPITVRFLALYFTMNGVDYWESM